MPDIRGGLLLKREQAIGTVDNINTNFSTSRKYISGTLEVQLNGQILIKDVDFSETSDTSFTMITPPSNDLDYTDVIMVEYQQK